MSELEKSTLKIFALYYVGLTILGFVISMFFEAGSSAAGILILFFSGYGATEYFVKTAKRVPELQERKRLSWWSILISFIISILLAAIVVTITGAWGEVISTFTQMPATPLAIMCIVMVLVVFLFYGVMRLCYGWLARKRYEKLFGGSR